MASYPASTPDAINKWPSATPDRPCPKCQHTNRCRIAPDGKAGICWRSGSAKPWHDDTASNNGNGKYHKPDPKPTAPKKTYTGETEAIAAARRSCKEVQANWIETTFKYTHNGRHYATVARWDDPRSTDKELRPVHAVVNGWAIGDPEQWYPYRVDELPATGPVYFLEGEGKTDLAWQLGLFATTTAHGSNAPHKTDLSALAGREVIILPDNDKPGRKYAEDVATILRELTCQ